MANIERNLNFEGVGDLQRVRGFYAAQGITFSENAVGLVDSDAERYRPHNYNDGSNALRW